MQRLWVSACILANKLHHTTNSTILFTHLTDGADLSIPVITEAHFSVHSQVDTALRVDHALRAAADDRELPRGLPQEQHRLDLLRLREGAHAPPLGHLPRPSAAHHALVQRLLLVRYVRRLVRAIKNVDVVYETVCALQRVGPARPEGAASPGLR